MRRFFAFAILSTLGLAGCSFAEADCECFNPPTAEQPDSIFASASVFGTNGQAQDDACENAEEKAQNICRVRGGSPGDCTCEQINPFRKSAPATAVSLKPIPDHTVPQARAL